MSISRRSSPPPAAVELAQDTGKDARLIEVILQEAGEVLRARPGVIIVADKAGHVMANARRRRLEPADRGRRARPSLARGCRRVGARDPGAAGRAHRRRGRVVINDSWGRAWRNGTIGHAVGVAGLPAVWDRRGEPDMYGRSCASPRSASPTRSPPPPLW